MKQRDARAYSFRAWYMFAKRNKSPSCTTPKSGPSIGCQALELGHHLAQAQARASLSPSPGPRYLPAHICTHHRPNNYTLPRPCLEIRDSPQDRVPSALRPPPPPPGPGEPAARPETAACGGLPHPQPQARQTPSMCSAAVSSPGPLWL